MTVPPPPDDGAERPFRIDHEPFLGFEIAVLTDRPVYAAGETVRITVTATNAGTRWARHHYPGWQRYVLSVRDEHHREVATDAVRRTWDAGLDRDGIRVEAGGPSGFTDRWLPGQMVIVASYWGQQEGPLVPSWSDDPPGPRVLPGRYRIRCTWLGREPGSYAELPDAWTPWFEIV
ncbi:MAG: hypothetical protein KY461_13490 [Actinobacteria bacterium]|nr:hypothetical protein [Actinomycetota bacterium]